MKLLIATALAVTPAFVLAQQNCAPRPVVVERLANQYGESVIGQGLMRDGNFMLEVFIHPQTGSWTVVTSTPAGMTCTRASGNDWLVTDPAIPDPSEEM